jgi:hypothetical protein
MMKERKARKKEHFSIIMKNDDRKKQRLELSMSIIVPNRARKNHGLNKKQGEQR